MNQAWLDRLMVGFLVICALLLRPSILGGTYTSLGLVGLIVVAVLRLLRGKSDGCKNPAYMPTLMLFGLLFVFWAYCIVLTVGIGNALIGWAIKGAATVLFTAAIYLWLGYDRDIYVGFYTGFARLNSLAGYSIVVTSLLLRVVPYNMLAYWHIPIENYEYIETNGDVLFPFTIIYGVLTEYDLYRFTGIGREPGIAQLFFVWAFSFHVLTRARWYWVVGALLGIFYCGSSAAMINFSVSIVFLFILKNNISGKIKATALIILVSAVAAALFMPGIGLSDKQETHMVSIEDRQIAMNYSLSLTGTDLLFGNGLFSFRQPVDQLGINAISEIYSFGVVGLLLITATIFSPLVWKGVDRLGFLACILPLVITAYGFQPICDSPLFYILAMYVPFDLTDRIVKRNAGSLRSWG